MAGRLKPSINDSVSELAILSQAGSDDIVHATDNAFNDAVDLPSSISVPTSSPLKNSKGKAGACEAVIRSLWSHIALPTVAEAGCRAISNLADFNRENIAKLCDAGVCEWGCRAVFNLADEDDDHKSKLGGTGACEALSGLILHHLQSLSLDAEL
eukprot:gene36190-47062_t